MLDESNNAHKVVKESQITLMVGSFDNTKGVAAGIGDYTCEDVTLTQFSRQ